MSHEHVGDDAELDAIAAALGSLAPARSRVDRDRVMFRAGQADAARRSASGRRAWMAVAAGLGLVALGEAAVLGHRPPRVVLVHEPAPAPVAPAREHPAVPFAVPDRPPAVPGTWPLALGRTAYERLAGQVLRYGLDGLPAPPPAGRDRAEPWTPPSRQLLEEELRKDLDLGDPS